MNMDHQLKRLVEAELSWVPYIDAANIGVAVDEGIVTLTGHVVTFSQKADVEKAVRRLKGVRGVAQDLQVRLVSGSGTADDEVAKRVVNSLDWSVNVPRDKVNVTVTGGVVTLTGEVDWQYQKTAAQQSIAYLHGVREVTNLITIKPQVKPADIKRRIEDALKRQAEVESSNIRVTVEGGNVRLDGKVHAWAEREAAERAAWAAPGVLSVADHVTVAY